MANSNIEQDLNKQGYKLIAGFDEVGRGCIAGPIVCAMVILPVNYKNKEINDSKKLSKKTRAILNEIIKNDALHFEIAIIDSKQVDLLNPKQASIKGMEMCFQQASIKPDFGLIDFEKINISIPTMSITKGDSKSISIAAASIIAKVFRDNLMDKLHDKYPLYDFINNKGYLTRKHRLSLERHKPIEGLHRFSYRPIRK